jgi:hypothetical protein
MFLLNKYRGFNGALPEGFKTTMKFWYLNEQLLKDIIGNVYSLKNIIWVQILTPDN